MGFKKFTTDVKNVSALPNKMQNRAEELKKTFDKGDEDQQTAFNGLIDELESEVAAGYIGAINPETKENSNVQDVLVSFNGRVDKLNEGKEGLIKDVMTGTELADDDTTAFTDVSDENVTKKTSFANIKAFFKKYFDTLYNNYVLPKATINSLGGIKPDGDTTTVDENGVLRAVAMEAADYTARNTLADHKDTNVNSEVGVHGIRFFNNILSYKDDEKVWQKIGDDTIDSRVSLLEKTIYNNIDANAFLIVFDSLTGINLSAGSYNTTTKVIEC